MKKRVLPITTLVVSPTTFVRLVEKFE